MRKKRAKLRRSDWQFFDGVNVDAPVRRNVFLDRTSLKQLGRCIGRVTECLRSTPPETDYVSPGVEFAMNNFSFEGFAAHRMPHGHYEAGTHTLPTQPKRRRASSHAKFYQHTSQPMQAMVKAVQDPTGAQAMFIPQRTTPTQPLHHPKPAIKDRIENNERKKDSPGVATPTEVLTGSPTQSPQEKGSAETQGEELFVPHSVYGLMLCREKVGMVERRALIERACKQTYDSMPGQRRKELSPAQQMTKQPGFATLHPLQPRSPQPQALPACLARRQACLQGRRCGGKGGGGGGGGAMEAKPPVAPLNDRTQEDYEREFLCDLPPGVLPKQK